jgi:ABC-type antimicrobial peptide transport system permease subunit
MATSEAVTMRDRIRDSPSVYFLRSSTWLVGGFAAAAWLLAVVGLYGVVAYSVSQRRREIAVRLALGAQPGSVYRLIAGSAARLTSAGIAGGILCSVGAATLLQGMLGGIGALDASTLGAVSLLLAVSALLASCIPARRAVSLGVIEALRTD